MSKHKVDIVGVDTSKLEVLTNIEMVELFKKFEATIPEGWTSGYSYIAGSLIKTGNYKDGVEYLKKACMLNCNEVRLVFGDMFPPNMPCENYYEFIKNVKF